MAAGASGGLADNLQKEMQMKRLATLAIVSGGGGLALLKRRGRA